MRPERSPFLFTVCQAGAEAALKRELGRHHPGLRPSFARPGFVTFKSAGDSLAADFELDSVFARAYGISLERAMGQEAVGRIIGLAREWFPPREGIRPRLHVFEREPWIPGEEPPGHEAGARARRLEAELRGIEGVTGIFDPEPLAGSVAEWVLDVIGVEEEEWWVGLHRHSARRSPHAGGRPALELPPEAPSRAYLKLEEALLWSGAPLRKGDTAVEIGSAPGGSSYALLRRGIRVVGIDPGQMAPIVLDFPGSEAKFTHLRGPVARVPREDLPDRVDWLLADMNVEPRITLTSVDRLGTRLGDSLLGVLITLKLNQWRMADEIPSYLEHFRAMGMVKLRATQLAHNRREIVVYGLTRKGRARAMRG